MSKRLFFEGEQKFVNSVSSVVYERDIFYITLQTQQ
jgi:hypothetical protein